MSANIKVNAELAAARAELESTQLQLSAKDNTVSVIQAQLAARVHDVAHFQVCVCVVLLTFERECVMIHNKCLAAQRVREIYVNHIR